MIHLIPQPKKLIEADGFLAKKAFFCADLPADERLVAAIRKLPLAEDGAALTVAYGAGGEGYTLTVSEDAVSIEAEGAAGAFYGIQTLRQLLKAEAVPCLTIEDQPDFAHRGFYHDMTRGKVATVATLKKLIDEMSYYKMNSLQLYVEHTFEFEECKDLN
ncbi:MAG: beta-N-acetylhexosaminidase, partial [Clostridia bacterium]|nr:beta-N-acetylhexosaminidase [Clostridia bacterium]